jgi:hypothetical protein
MKLNLKRLKSIETTLEAIESIDKSIEWYKEDLPGPAYMTVTEPCAGQSNTVHFQVDRKDFREFMNQRKKQLIEHLEDRYKGFEYDPDADWKGDHNDEI